jgi:hypothetical protein
MVTPRLAADGVEAATDVMLREALVAVKRGWEAVE